MTRSTKPGFCRLGIGQKSAGETAIVRADARADAGVIGVDRHRVGGPVGIAVGVILHHRGEIERVGERRGEWRADQSGGVSDHKCCFGGGEVARGDY